MTGYTTHEHAERNDGEMLGEIERAIRVFRNDGEVNTVDLAGFRLTRTNLKTWRIHTREEQKADQEIIDEFDPSEFRSAQEILEYMRSIIRMEQQNEGGECNQKSTSDEGGRPVTRNHAHHGVI